MTRSKAKAYLMNMSRVSGIKFDDVTDLDALVDTAIDLGLSELWNARSWSWRTKTTSIDTSTSAVSYDLPSDFDGVKSVKEDTSLTGQPMFYLPKEEFDAHFPRPGAYGSDYPSHYTIWYEEDENRWKIAFFPLPSISNIDIVIFTTAPGAIDNIPGKAQGALLVCMEQYLYPSATTERKRAAEAYGEKLKQLETADSPFKGDIYKIHDDTDTNIRRYRPWIDPD